jgi:hypothetical protein
MSMVGCVKRANMACDFTEERQAAGYAMGDRIRDILNRRMLSRERGDRTA